MLKKFRFWLSNLFFEKFLKRDPVKDVAKKIIKETDLYNEEHNSPRCLGITCNNKDVREQRTGSEGLFTQPHKYWVCVECGHVQDNNGASYKRDFEELDKKRIIKDGDTYRYRFFTNEQIAGIYGIGTVLIVFLIFLYYIFKTF